MPREAVAKMVHVNALVPWENNPRLNDGEPVEVVAESISRFGFASPIIARKENNEIIAGHTRWKAAQMLGLEKVPVRFMDLTEDEAHALALVDNKAGEIAMWDEELLTQTIRELQEANVELEGLGWGTEELELMLEGDAFALTEEGETTTVSEHERQLPNAMDVDEEDDVIPDVPDEVEANTEEGEVLECGPITLHCADCMDVMDSILSNSIDAIVTDPPYGLRSDGKAVTWDDEDSFGRGFMGNEWDSAVPGVRWAREALRVLKPGGHIIAFSGTRTVHRLAVSLEDAGFQIRDQISWVNFQGFPKSLDASRAIDQHYGLERKVVGKGSRPFVGDGPTNATSEKGGFASVSSGAEFDITEPACDESRMWAGWGTALKPATEPAVLARKPLGGTVAANVLKWGTGALNIDGCRFAYGDPAWVGPQDVEEHATKGRVTPAPSSWSIGPKKNPYADHPNSVRYSSGGRWPANIYYCPKASRSEREEGLEELESGEGTWNSKKLDGRLGPNKVKNIHATVKPVQVMRWLLRLVVPPGGTVLEPFAGSGSTLVAAVREGNMSVIAAEREPRYCDIAIERARSAIGRQADDEDDV